VALAAAGTAGAAGLTAAVAIPVLATTGDDEPSFSLGVQPSPSPTAAPGKCYLVYTQSKGDLQGVVRRLVRSGKVGSNPSVVRVKPGKNRDRTYLEVCSEGASPTDPNQDDSQGTEPPAGPRYHYTEKPEEISARLGMHLNDRVGRFGLSVTYTRPFSQESSHLDDGRPTYYGGNVDVHESAGYGDIGVQVMHEVTVLVPFDGDCKIADDCTETTLPDGGLLRTGRVPAGRGDVVLTAEVHRPDGVIVQAQESNYPFGPDAGSQPHGDQPLTLDQLVALAKDDAFTF
jgi:hypothetical protein